MFDEPLDQWHDPFMRVFDHPVAGVFDAVDFGMRKKLAEALEERWCETPIAHAPD